MDRLWREGCGLGEYGKWDRESVMVTGDEIGELVRQMRDNVRPDCVKRDDRFGLIMGLVNEN